MDNGSPVIVRTNNRTNSIRVIRKQIKDRLKAHGIKWAQVWDYEEIEPEKPVPPTVLIYEVEPDWDEVNAVLGKYSKPRFYPVQDTGGSWGSVVLGEEGLTPKDVDTAYHSQI